MTEGDCTKKCTACGEIKPRAEFGTRYDKRADKRYPNGRCKPCDKQATRAAYAADPQRYRDYQNKYGEQNREKCAARARRHYWENRGEIAARRRRARPSLSPSEIAEVLARRAERERDYNREYLRQYRPANGHRFRAYQANYRAGIELTPGKVTPRDVAALLERQEGKCLYCNRLFGSKYHIEHMTPLSRGGTNDPENIVLSCGPCNLAKGTMTAQEFTARRS